MKRVFSDFPISGNSVQISLIGAKLGVEGDSIVGHFRSKFRHFGSRLRRVLSILF